MGTIASVASIRELISRDRTVFLVGGAFDLLHVGHVHLLNYAKRQADVLVVSVLSDDYVRSYKGPKRPLVPESQRVIMVSALKAVDHAYISSISSYQDETLQVLSPNVIIFGVEKDPARVQRIEQKILHINRIFPDIKVLRLARFNDNSVSSGKIVERMNDLE